MILRRLLSASASGLAFLALSAGPASADPVSTFIIGAIGLTGTAAAVAGFVIKTALWTGASHLIGKVLGPRKQGSQARQADIASLSLGEVAREMIAGRTVTGGSLVQGFNWGGANGTDNETLVIAIADELCDGLEGVLVDDQFIAHTGDGDVAGTGGGLNIRWRNGAPGQTLPADLRAMAGFTAADRLVGVAHVWVTYTAKWAQERGGRPRLRFRVRGGRRYDPRKDSTVPGGSGAHRWSNPATWEWTENLVLNRYAYQRGVFCEGRVSEPEQLWVGRGLSAVEAPPERIIPWANLCDEAVALKGGGSEPRWRVGGVIHGDETYIEVDEKFAAACGGTIIQPEGGIEVEPGHGKASVVHITDDDLMAGEPVQFSEFLPETERFNTVVTRYVDPAQDWQFHSAPVRRSTGDIAADGGPYTLPVDLELVTSGTQAQRVGEILRRKARLENRATIPLGPRFSWLEAGDWVVWTSARWLRGATKTFRITADPLDEGWRMKAALEEMQSAVFGWTPASDEITPQTAPPDLWSKPGPIALTGVGVAVIDRNGIPGLRFTWTTPVDPAVTSVTVEVRVKGEAQSTVSLTREPNSGQLDLTDGVAPETLMEARAWPAGSPDRDIQPSPWVEIGAGILRAGETQTPRPYAADTIKNTFTGLTGFSAANATLALPTGDHSIQFTPTGAGTTTHLNWTLGRPGERAHRVRLRIRAVGADITAAMWDGRMTYSTPALGHSLTAGRFASIPFPAGGLPAGQWRDVEFQADGLTDYLDSTINQLRFYLVKPTSGRIDVGRIEAGYAGGATEGARAGTDIFRTDGVTPMTQAEVRTPEGTSAFVAGQAPAATDPTIVPGAGRVFTGEETVDRTPGDYVSLISGNGTRFEAKQPASIGVTEVADVLSVIQVDKVGSGSANIIMTLRSRDGVIFQRRGSNATTWTAWQKQFGRQSRPNFDAGDLLDIGSTVASRANFRTDLGTSAFLAGQTDWATLGLPTTRLNHLDNSGNLASLERVAARDLALLTGRTANHLSYVGGGGLSVEALRPGEAGANVTEIRTAAFVAGQAPAATDPTIVPGAGRVFTGAETVDRTPGDYQSLISGNGTRFEAKLPASIGVTEVADVLSVIQVDKVGSGSANIIMTLRSRDGVIFQRRGSNATTWTAWQKQFGRQSRPTFDAGDLLDIGSTVASRANFRTDLGTSAFVAGQTDWATLGLPTTRLNHLDDSGNLASLERVAARDLALLTGRTANHLTYVGGGGVSVESLRPGEGGANVTEIRTAAFFAGQGLMAVKNSVGTLDLDTAAVNQMDGGYTDANIVIDETGWVAVASDSITLMAGEKITVTGKFSYSRGAPSGSFHNVRFELRRGSTVVDRGEAQATDVGPNNVDGRYTLPGGQLVAMATETPGPGTYTYSLYARGGDPAAGCVAFARSISFITGKKAG